MFYISKKSYLEIPTPHFGELSATHIPADRAKNHSLFDIANAAHTEFFEPNWVITICGEDEKPMTIIIADNLLAAVQYADRITGSRFNYKEIPPLRGRGVRAGARQGIADCFGVSLWQVTASQAERNPNTGKITGWC